MKLIYIANTTLPTKRAHGLQIMKMCDAFFWQGAVVELVTPKRFTPAGFGGKDPFAYYAVGRNFKIKKIFCLDLIVLDKVLGALAFWGQSLSFTFFLLFYLLGQKKALIYSRDRVSLFFISLFFKKTVFEVHKISRWFFWGAVRRAKKIVVISQGLRDKLTQQGIAPEKILVAPDGVALADFNLAAESAAGRQKLALPLDKKIIVYTGHLYSWKGADNLVLAAAYLSGNQQVVIIGGLPQDIRQLKKMAAGKAIKNIVFLGHRDWAQIPYFLRAADCLVLTGTKKAVVSEKYTSPLKMFEYMAAQKPIVASDLPSFREILNEGNAILVEPDNPRALAMGIKRALADQALAEKIARQAQKDVWPYDWRQRAKNILAFIHA
ncbi:MAG: hypothetical protein COU85_01630 [Candidatus Portnoybacteria bacterium CG10_big_fil_rev_8_21_14_0_10_44_7]|uniref:Glycosyl transferase family 1 domain-containing protein n=1 Tax=Candidatus Portnoybacteria bacterium CG10_big_fil_rev_8_21_14_0_10_44_7 TaxID=1974816 RepID=A0A2M8KIT4_9BACT|nr:MAG: hypothetical protein COU85_01630 [Candidatus Portnoybacteria bacterium CG10_big_fil_rev_8_21_14_0_10_44_7]